MLAYRAIAIWLPAPIGLVALGALRRTIAAWGHEDAADAVEVIEVEPARRSSAHPRASGAPLGGPAKHRQVAA